MKINSKQENGELVIELRFDGHDQLCLNHDLIDIVDWYASGPVHQKIFNCRDRMIKENKEKLLASPEIASKTMAEVNAIFNDPKVLCEAISKMPSYKNRAQRESESK